MGDAVFKLFAYLGLDTSDYDKGLEGAESSASSFGDKLKKGFTVATGIATTAIAATTGATIAGTKAFVEGVSAVAQYGDNIDKMSQKLNMSAETYQEWDFVMQHCGTSIENMQSAIKTLSNAVETDNEAFEALGMSQEEIANMSGEELFSATITALQDVEDETQRTYLAGKLLGRGATELGALLNMTATETAEMKYQAHELGGVLSDEAVKSSAQFQDSLQNMQTAFTGMKNSMLSNFLPSFSTVMDGLAKVFSGDSEGGLGLIKSGVQTLATDITELVPTFVQVGGTILEALASAIIENLPVLIESGIGAVETFVDGIIDNADMILTAVEKIISIFTSKFLDADRAAKIVQTAINIIAKLANGLIEALPQLIPAIMKVIVEIIRVLTQPDNIKLLIDCANQLLLALAMGIVEAIPILIEVIPEVIVNLVQAIIENFPAIIDTSLELIGALALAIFSAIATLMGTNLEEVGEGLQIGFNMISEWGAGIVQWIAGIGTTILNGITGFWNSVTSFFSNGFNTVKNNVTNALNAVKKTFTDIFDNVKTTVYNAIEYLKGLFNFEWKLPDLKLPHFTISGEFSLDPTNLQLPTIGVEWYKKAYEEPYILEGATIFGSAGGRLLGGGEGGSSEVVVGTNRLMEMISAVVKQALDELTFVIPVYIGGKKIDQQVVTANARNAVVSGGR